MNTLKLYQIDAFTRQILQGNPAAVIPLKKWLPDSLLQSIALENNLSETAYFVPTRKGFHLRWFTPGREVDLCGHATLASAFVLFDILNYPKKSITFETKSGILTVIQKGDSLQMDFPARPGTPCKTPKILEQALGRKPLETLRSDDYIAVFSKEEEILSISPDLSLLSRLDLRGVCVTAPGRKSDFVSRVFAPKYGIPEDPVTGSAHCELAPYWASKFGKNKLHARQLSRRGGEIGCELRGDRVLLSGQAVKYLEGEICVPTDG